MRCSLLLGVVDKVIRKEKVMRMNMFVDVRIKTSTSIVICVEALTAMNFISMRFLG
jgi:hypothetical protein